MSSSTPPRRFKPEPFETSSASTSQKPSKLDGVPDDTTKPPRRFAPQPLETSTRHGTRNDIAKGQDCETDATDDSSETIRSTSRTKFAPTPVEVTHKSNRKRIIHGEERKDVDTESPDESSDDSKRPARRKHLAQPVDINAKSHRQAGDKSGNSDVPLLSRETSDDDQSGTAKRTLRRFAPEPVETGTKSHRKVAGNDKGKTPPPDELPQERKEPQRKPSRRFKVEVLETATRSRRSGDEGPTMLLSDRTNSSPGDATPKKSDFLRPGPSPLPPANTPVMSATEVHQLKPPPLRQSSLHPHYNTPRANTRSHAFKVPSLDDIESSGSEPSKPPSLSRSHSDSEPSISSEALAYQHPTRRRESVDDKFSGYLLALAARTAEKQLREQAAAAFPNDDSHSPVAHYMDTDDSDDEPSPDLTRRDSSDGQAALREMRRHGEKVYEENKKQDNGERKKTAVFNVEFDSEAHQDAWSTPEQPKKLIGGRQDDPDLRPMRKAAAPPMLGDDIDFPRCPSPDHARFDVTQGSEFLKHYLQDSNPQQQGGLWGSGLQVPQPASGTSSGSKSPVSEAQPSSDSGGGGGGGGGGLWGGSCIGANTKEASQPGLFTPIRTPATTPKLERDDPFSHVPTMTDFDSSSVASGRQRFPPSPPASTSSQLALNSLDSKLELDAQLDSEFPDVFVTQVYNYLSLGYPALARKFDIELSKISGVAVNELRQDDVLAEARGYIRLGDDEPVAAALAEHAGSRETRAGGISNEVISEDVCARWRALKLYVREWGRQQLNKPGGLTRTDVRADEPHRAWGMPARKGSWGF